MKKYELYLISLSLLFLFIFLLTVPVCWKGKCNLIIDFSVVYIFCIINLILFIYTVFLTFKLKIRLKSNQHTPFRIENVKNDSYEHLTFLVTYIIPLVAFDFSNYRYQLLFIILIGIIGYMYAKTDMYYSNPSLALLGYSIFRVEAVFRDGTSKTITVLSKDKIEKDNEVSYIPLSNNVYIGTVR